MSRTTACGSTEFLDEEDQRYSEEGDTAEQSKAVHESIERSLIFEQPGELRSSVNCGVRGGVSVARKIVCKFGEPLAVRRINGTGMFGEDRLMVLGAAREHGGDKSDSETAALIAK